MKRTAMLCLGAAAVVNAAIIGYGIMRGFPADAGPIPIARDTTFIVGPLDGEGNVDYTAALNDRYSRGVVPDENALVMLWSVFGAKSMRHLPPDKYFHALGMAPPTAEQSLLVEFDDLLSEAEKADDEKRGRFYDEYARAGEKPWTARECPTVAEWVKRNEPALAKLDEVLRRSKYYRPIVCSADEEEDNTLLGAPAFELGILRELGRLLSIRALGRAATGEFAAAFDDLLACRRLGRLASHGPFMLDSMVAYTLSAIAVSAEREVLKLAVPAADLRRYLKGLQSLPPHADPIERIEYGERYIHLENLAQLRKEQGRWSRIDLAPALREGNRWYDRFAAVRNRPDDAARLREFRNISADAAALKRKFEARLGDESRPADVLNDDELGAYFISIFMPAGAFVYESFVAREQESDLSQLAVALALFHAEHGRYPTTLAELQPKCLAEIPRDRFVAAPLIYRLQADGYVLYSVGADEHDDGGVVDRHQPESTEGPSDFVIRGKAK